MTVLTTTAKAGPYAGAGTTGPFSVPFRFLENAHLRVIKTSTAGVDADLVLTTDYTVTGAGASSGTVTLVAPLAVGEKLTVIRNVPATQEADYVPGDAFPAESHEVALDKLTMLVQQQGEEIGRSLRMAPSVSGASTVLPTPQSNRVIGWNESATALQNLQPSDFATLVAYGTTQVDPFLGDGTTRDFTLSFFPGSVNNIAVTVDGATYVPGVDYTWASGQTLTFTVAPLAGQKILARYMRALPQGTADAGAVSYVPASGPATDVQTRLRAYEASGGSALIGYLLAGTGAVATNVQSKLREFVSVKDFGAVGDGVANDAPAIALAINAVIAAGGGTVLFPAGQYKCATRIGTFTSAEDVTLLGYGAEIQNFAGSNVNGLMQFGNAAVDGNGMYSASATTVRNLNILGLKFTSSNVFNGLIPGRWSDQMPISVNTAKDVLIRDCYFENWDFSAIDFGAICRDCLVDACSFYSSQVDAGANYGVRAFCYANYTNYSNGNGDLDPTSSTTGVLKGGYALISDSATNWGHENVSVTNCYFENVSHGVMVSAARRGVIANNRFKNMSTRSISLTTYSTDYLCLNNVHSLDTTEQTSSGVSVFYGLGQATYRHQIQGDKFTVIGATNNAAGFSPIKCYLNSHDWVIADCDFYLPTFNPSGARCIAAEDNSDGTVRDNHFNCPGIAHPVYFGPVFNTASPGFQQDKIQILGNTFEAFSAGAIWVNKTTSSPEPLVIKDNVVYGNPTRFVAHTADTSGQRARLYLDGNEFLGSPVRYIDNIVTANKAIILHRDILEIDARLSTGGGVANPSTTAVSFDFSAFHLPACFTSGVKRYLFTAYGGRENSQLSTDFIFRITGETATSISGDIVRNAGSSFQSGNVALKVIWEPFNT